MKKSLNILSAASLILLVSLYAGCRSYDDPAPIPAADVTPNITIAELKDMYTGAPTEILNNYIIGGRVISSDQYGNVYRTMYIQDETGGIEVKVGKTGLYNVYSVNQMVYVMMENLTLGDYGGMVNIGLKDPTGQYGTAYIDVQTIIDRKILPGERATSDRDVVQPTVVTDYSQLTKDLEGSLVKLVGAVYTGESYTQFYDDEGNRISIDTLTTWSLAADPNHPVIPIPASAASQTFSLGSRTFVVRTSGYARFARERVETRAPIGKPVEIVGIYTTYNGAKQIVLNDSRDVSVIE